MFGEDEIGPNFSPREGKRHQENSSTKERGSSVMSNERPRHTQAKKIAKRVADIKLSFGFLRRLEEEGYNVNIGTDINDILFLDEREREIKEKMEEEALKKSRKPRPRDIIDFEEIKNR